MAVEIENLINEPSEAEKRIKQLSGKVAETASERDSEKAAREAAETRASEAERKAAFAESFTEIVASNPAAKEFKADIQAKVMAGYTPEDAAFAVLGKAGKLGQPREEEVAVAGGSAATAVSSQGNKSPSDMTQSEKRAELEKLLTVS